MATETDTTPPSEPHRLTGSSPPSGEVPNFEPVAQPRPAPRIDDQAKLIRHANRVAVTAREESLAARLRSELEDRLWAEGPQQPEKLPRPATKQTVVDRSTDTESILLVTNPKGTDPAWAEWERANAAAQEAFLREQEAFKEEIGLSAQEQLSERLFDRLAHQAEALAKMKATSIKALAAMGNAYVEIVCCVGGDAGGNPWIEHLAVSIAHDAAEIGIHGSRAVSPETLDADLLELIARHEAALVEQDEADRVSEQCDEAFKAERPTRPAELYWQATDGPVPAGRQHLPNGNVRPYYLSDEIDAMRAAAVPMKMSTGLADSPEGTGMAWRPDVGRIARRAEIIAAWDAWLTEMDAAKNRIGVTVAFEAADAAWNRSKEIEDALMAVVPMTHAGLVAKARWLAVKGWSEEHLGDLALKIVKDITSTSAVFFGADRDAHVPDRRALEAYAEWLDMERRLLTIEMFPDAGAEVTRYSITGSAARNFHYPLDKDHRSAAPPSCRAEEMMDRLGIDWRAEDPKATIGAFRYAYGPLDDAAVVGEVA